VRKIIAAIATIGLPGKAIAAGTGAAAIASTLYLYKDVQYCATFPELVIPIIIVLGVTWFILQLIKSKED
jgi:hypothetical protein